MKKFLSGLLFLSTVLALGAVDAPGSKTGKPSATAIDGSGAANRLAYYSDADTLTSSAGLTFDGTSFAYGASGSTATHTIRGSELLAVTNSSSASFLFYRSVTTGAIRILAGTGAASGSIELFGSAHATKPGFVEISNNVGTGMQIDTNMVARFNGQMLSPLHAETGMTGTAHTIDWNNANVHTLDLQDFSGNVTLTFSNPVSGAVYYLKLIQSSTARTITWPATVKWPAGLAPTITVTNDAIDLITCVYDGTSYLCSAQLAFG